MSLFLSYFCQPRNAWGRPPVKLGTYVDWLYSVEAKGVIRVKVEETANLFYNQSIVLG